MKKIFVLTALITLSFLSSAQQISDIKVTEYFNFVSADHVFKTLEIKYGIKINYDSVLCSSFTGYTHTFSGTDANLVIMSVCRTFHLTYTIDKNNVVLIQGAKQEQTDDGTNTVKNISKSATNIKYSGASTSSNITVSGVLKDKNTGEALPFAAIKIKGTSNGTVTNADGHFTLLKVPTDTSTLSIAFLGYDNAEFYLSPQMSKTNLVVEIGAAHTLNEVVVTAEREELMSAGIKTEVGVIKMSPQKMATLPNLGEKDVMRSFQLMPGVGGSNESSSGLYVLGGTPDQNLVLYDGFTVYHVDHLYGFFSAFNSNALKDMELYKGAYPALYGGRLSSVLDITSKDGNQKKVNVGGDLSLLSCNAFAEIPIGDKFSSFFAIRRSFQGPIYNEIFREFNNKSQSSGAGGFGGRGSSSTPTSYFYDLNCKLTYKPTNNDIISLSFYNGTDHLDNSFERSSGTSAFSSSTTSSFSFTNTDLTKYGNTGSSLKWSHKYGARLYGTTLISYSNYFSDRTLTNSGSITSSSGEVKTFNTGTLENNNLKDYSIKTDYLWDVFKNNQIGYGAFSTYYDVAYSYSQNDTSTILQRHNFGNLTGVYLQDRIKLFHNFMQLTAGVRESYFNITNKPYTEPRFSAIFNLTDRISLKAATGQFYQFANRITREDILSGSTDFWILSDKNNIPVSSSIHYITSIQYESNRFLFSVEAYYKVLSNIADYSLQFNRVGQTYQADENFYTGTGTSKGLEFLVQKKYGRFTGWVSYTLGQALDHFSAYSQTDFPASNDVTHEIKVVLLYNWKRWDFSTTFIYATGEPYTAPSGAYPITLIDGNQRDYFTVSSKNSLRLPDYNRLDIAASYKLLVNTNSGKREIGSIGVSIFNVYNQTNVWYKTYQIIGTQIVETNVNYLGLVPNITLSLKLR